MDIERDTAAALLDSTVRVIARDGLDKASVRTISADCNVPNPYIYQFFRDKDDLFVSAFSREDAEIEAEFDKTFSSVFSSIPDRAERCQILWLRLWNHMMSHREQIQFYVRYYYSTYYEHYSREKHQELYRPLAEKVRECFADGANTQVLLQHILDNMMNLAMKVYSGELEDTGDTRPQFFALTISAIAQYFRDEEQKASEES